MRSGCRVLPDALDGQDISLAESDQLLAVVQVLHYVMQDGGCELRGAVRNRALVKQLLHSTTVLPYDNEQHSSTGRESTLTCASLMQLPSRARSPRAMAPVAL